MNGFHPLFEALDIRMHYEMRGLRCVFFCEFVCTWKNFASGILSVFAYTHRMAADAGCMELTALHCVYRVCGVDRTAPCVSGVWS